MQLKNHSINEVYKLDSNINLIKTRNNEKKGFIFNMQTKNSHIIISISPTMRIMILKETRQ